MNNNPSMNGEAPNPLRAHQERNLVQPPFRLTEALVEDIGRLARLEGLTPAQLVTKILRPAVRTRFIEIEAKERTRGLKQWESPDGPAPQGF